MKMVRTTLFQGCNFSYQLRGHGEPVVFIQGVGLHGEGWRPQTEVLSKSFCCLSFDNRGMGWSQSSAMPVSVPQMAADTFAVMDAAGMETAHLVGHSLGGCVAQQAALSKPERVKSLSLLCTSARGSDATRLTWKMMWLGARSRIGTRRMRRHAFLQMVLTPHAIALQGADRCAQDLAPIFGHDLADSPPIVLPQLGALRHFDASSRLAELAGFPVLVVSASGDPIFPAECGRRLAESIPGARFVEIKDARHGVTIEHACTINELLAAHIAGSRR